MKTSAFNNFCQALVNVGHIEDTKQRDIELSAIMSMRFIFLDLTDLQVKHLQRILAAYFPDKYIVYAEPDEHGFTAKFEYLRFK